MSPPLIRKLNQYATISSTDEELISRVTSQRPRQFASREDIIREGDKPDVINVIREGWACRYKVLEDGRRQIIAFFLPGDICDLNVFVLKEMDHSVGAITPVALSEITREAFDQLMLGHPRVTQALWWDSLVNAAIQREWTVNLGQRDAFERMGHLFCELFIRLRSVGLVKGNSFELPLIQSELGDAMGISTVHVNRTLQDLRSAKLIVLKSGILTIPDLEALQEASLFNDNYLHLNHEGRHLSANERESAAAGEPR